MSAERLLDATELAGQLGVSKRWIYAHVAEHDLPAYRIGKSLAFEFAAVRAWLETRRIGDWPESCGDAPTDASLSLAMYQKAQSG
jgi:excisionase family DNA binding protein